MKQTVLLPDTALFNLNAFDVGNNPAHVDFGLMKHQFAQKVEGALSEEMDSVVLSGLSIELLDEESPELLESLVSKIKKENISVVGALYYHTSLKLLDEETFGAQWSATREKFEEVGLVGSSLYIGGQSVPKELSQPIAQLRLNLVGNTLVDAVGGYSALNQSMEPSELASHIASELIAMQPHLKGDMDLHTTWQLIGNNHMQEQLQGEEPQQTYESYFTMMHIMNDMAHTVRQIELTKRGEFENEAQIVDSPSQRILEVK